MSWAARTSSSGFEVEYGAKPSTATVVGRTSGDRRTLSNATLPACPVASMSASRTAASVSCRPVAPKSPLWLLATLSTVKPAEAKWPAAVGSARNA